MGIERQVRRFGWEWTRQISGWLLMTALLGARALRDLRKCRADVDWSSESGNRPIGMSEVSGWELRGS
jgi:hypothetical protein